MAASEYRPELTAAIRDGGHENCPEMAMKLPGGGHENCPTHLTVSRRLPSGVPFPAWLSGANRFSAGPGVGTREVCRGNQGILAAYGLTGSLRGAAELAGCSHHTGPLWAARVADEPFVGWRAFRPTMMTEACTGPLMPMGGQESRDRIGP
jgi:hypothetical protein